MRSNPHRTIADQAVDVAVVAGRYPPVTVARYHVLEAKILAISKCPLRKLFQLPYCTFVSRKNNRLLRHTTKTDRALSKSIRSTDENRRFGRPTAESDEAAARLSLSRSAIYALMVRGQLPYVKIGKSRRIKPQEVDRLIEEGTVKPPVGS